jgi:hypothetical protein
VECLKLPASLVIQLYGDAVHGELLHHIICSDENCAARHSELDRSASYYFIPKGNSVRDSRCQTPKSTRCKRGQDD